MNPNAKLAVVYLRWAVTPGDLPLVQLAAHLARDAPSPIAVCVVDNRPGLPPVTADIGKSFVTSGRNSEREFSGYEAGVHHLREQGMTPDLWLLANDRFDAYGLDPLELLSARSLDVAASLGCALGQMDGWPHPANLFGFDIATWARSNLLVVPERSLQAMGSLVSVNARAFNGLLAEPAPSASELAEPAPLLRKSFGVAWGELAAEWLTGRGNRLRSHWYRAGPVDEASWPGFRGKVHSIVNEQLLSARLRHSGTPVISLPLAAEVASLPATSVRRLTSSAIRRWPTRSAAVAGTRGVVWAVRSFASVESSVRAGVRGAFR